MIYRAIFLNFAKSTNRRTGICSLLHNSRSFSSSDKHYDVIVVGGGLIGTTLACALGKNSRLSDKRILLLEASKRREYIISEKYSNRVSSINQSTKTLLNDIGAWKHIESTRFSFVKEMQVWESNSEAMINFGADSSEENIAYIVENDVILKAVWEELQKLNNVEIIHEAVVKDCKLANGRHNRLELQDGSAFTSDILLGCDGWNSQVRQKMGVHYLSWNYNQMGVVATLELEEECENTIAWQRFLPTGPIALLPLNSKLSSLVWSTTPQHSKQLLSLTDQGFVEALNKSLWNSPKRNPIVDEGTKAIDQFLKILNLPTTRQRQLPPKIVACQEGSRAAFPLGFGHASNYVMEGAALVGDAAHRVHPLAGQGVNLGFGDITCLNKILGEAVYAGSEIGSLLYLKNYETARQRHNIPTMLAIDGLHRLYGTDFPPTVFLRSIGLQAFNALQPLKSLIKSHAAS